MRRPRSGIGAELVPLVLILACLAGTLAMIVSVHRQVASRRASRPAVALPPTSAKPAPYPAPARVVEPEAEEPEPPPPPTPEDPTPKALAKLVSAEAEQLLEASKADRKAAALEEARKAAQAESERWRRRESLVRLQLDSLDSKVRKMEKTADEMALERDALEKELDARKAMAAQARSRPGQAILPHRGANGTWRRPIVVECRNGMAILQPQGIGFGLLELSSGFGPASNPFVATVAREAIRIQGNASPDGRPVVPYIFFLVRPDGIRPYYEARGRLEPLGITFGYELADQEWEVDFPDLDDVKTWDGSAPALPGGSDPLAQTPPLARGASPAEDEDFPSWGSSRRGRSPSIPIDGPAGGFVWPPRSPALPGNGGGGVKLGNLGGAGSGSGRVQGGGGGGSRAPSRPGSIPGDPRAMTFGRPDGPDPLGGGPSGTPDGLNSPSSGTGPLVGGQGGPSIGSKGDDLGSGPGTGTGTMPADPPSSGIPGDLALGGGPITPLGPANGPIPGSLGGPSGIVPPRGAAGGQGSGHLARGGQPPVAADPSAGQGGVANQDQGSGSGKDDPANTFVWPAKPKAGSRSSQGNLPGQPSGDGPDSAGPDQSPPVRHVGPFSRPLAMGIDTLSSSTEADPTQPDGSGVGGSSNPSGSGTSGSSSSSGRQGSGGSQAARRVIGPTGSSSGQPASSSSSSTGVGLSVPNPGGTASGGMPSNGMPPSGSPPSSPPNGTNRSPSLPEVSSPSIVDRRFEMVLVCGPRGVIVQPGGYRVTSEALGDRDGLLKKQMVALVKARRTADPKTIIEPRVKFLVQPGGDKTYWTARSQFLLSGLDWPMSLQVADPDHLGILPSESW